MMGNNLRTISDGWLAETRLFVIVLDCIVLYCITLYCIVLYCIVLYCIVLYCIFVYFQTWVTRRIHLK